MPIVRITLPAEKRALREKMRALGLGHREIAAEFARRYRLRPRAAWREAHGWSLREAAAQINAYTGTVGLDPGGISSMTAPHLCEHENWPGPGPQPSGRRPSPYLLALLACVYGCTAGDLIDLADREQLPPAELLILDTYGQEIQNLRNENRPSQLPRPSAQSAPQQALSARPGITYRGKPEPGSQPRAGIEREVLMAAHEGSDHAEQAERRDIGDATLEQLRADVVRLSLESMTAEPFLVFREMRRVRSRIHGALDRQLWPRDQTELYFLLGALNCLMAVAASDLGYPQAGEELIRAAWAYATAIDHRPLMAHLRLELAGIAYWARPRQSRDLAQSGLRYLSDGPNAAQLYLQYGRAAARLGDATTARRAIESATEARERVHQDDLLEIGGEFGFSRATQHYMAGSGLIEISQGQSVAIEELQRATELYAAGPGPGEQYGFGCVALAHVDLATALLRAGRLDAAAAALGPALAISPGQRIRAIPERLGRVRAELARNPYQGSPQATELDEQIEDFTRETIVRDLHDLPAGSD
jgi:tetratricopeptide (TPR) repeat protein